MFEQSILVQKRTSKPWSILLSLAAELAGIGLLVVAPLIWAQRLPGFAVTKIAVWIPLAPTPAPEPVHPATSPGPRTKPSPFAHPNPLVAPAVVPDRVNAFNDPPPQITGGEPFSSGRESRIGISGVGNTPGPPAPVRHTVEQAQASQTIRLHVSHLESAKVLYQAKPVYPALARATHTSGTVHLMGVIATDGTIQSLHVLSGSPLLVKAAVDAVRQWRYQPTVLNGQAVEVEAPIDVTFTLQ